MTWVDLKEMRALTIRYSREGWGQGVVLAGIRKCRGPEWEICGRNGDGPWFGGEWVGTMGGLKCVALGCQGKNQGDRWWRGPGFWLWEHWAVLGFWKDWVWIGGKGGGEARGLRKREGEGGGGEVGREWPSWEPEWERLQASLGVGGCRASELSLEQVKISDAFYNMAGKVKKIIVSLIYNFQTVPHYSLKEKP